MKISRATALRIGQEACAFPRYKFESFHRGLMAEFDSYTDLDTEEIAEIVIANLDADPNHYPPTETSRISHTLPPEREDNPDFEQNNFDKSIVAFDTVRQNREYRRY